MKNTAFVWLALVSLAPGEMVPMFSENDFTGWGAPGKNVHAGYKIEDGVVTSTPQCKILFTDREYTDYVMEFEFRLTPAANNGLGIHYTGEGDPAYNGMELQILDDTGEKYQGKLKDYQWHGSLYTLAAAKKGALKPVGEWNHQRVTVNGPEVTVVLNGQEILSENLDELEKAHPKHEGVKRRKGKIAFCGHGDEISLRKVMIDEGVPIETESLYYPPGEADESLSELGFQPLFDGKNLDSWKLEEGHKGHWTIEDGWILAYAGDSTAKDKNLWTKEEFGDLQLVCDWRWAGPGEMLARPYIDRQTGAHRKGADGKDLTVMVEEVDSGIFLRGFPKAQVNMWNWPVGSGEVYGYRIDRKQSDEVRAAVTPKATADNPLGEWNRFVITLKGETLTVVLNGRVVIEEAQLPGVPAKGPMALQHHGSKIDFANIWVKSL